jgi:hypothetical protein
VKNAVKWTVSGKLDVDASAITSKDVTASIGSAITVNGPWTSSGNLSLVSISAGITLNDNLIASGAESDVSLTASNAALTLVGTREVTAGGSVNITTATVGSPAATVTAGNRLTVTSTWSASGVLELISSGAVADPSPDVTLNGQLTTTGSSSALSVTSSKGAVVLGAKHALTSSQDLTVYGQTITSSAACNLKAALGVLAVTGVWTMAGGSITMTADSAVLAGDIVITGGAHSLSMTTTNGIDVKNAVKWTVSGKLDVDASAITSKDVNASIGSAITVNGPWTSSGDLSLVSTSAGITLNDDLVINSKEDKGITLNGHASNGVLTTVGGRAIVSSGDITVSVKEIVSASL